jgi:hypothetical protein
MEPLHHSPPSPAESSEEPDNIAQVTMTESESVPSSLLPSNTATPQPSFPGHTSCDDTTEQPFRFSDLPTELRDRIYAFATHPGTERNHDGEEFPITPELTTGFSKSPTARSLSQVSRSVRKESMEVYYSKTTFQVLNVKDTWSKRMSSPIPPNRDPMDRWVETWGVLAGPHIRFLSISALSYTPVVVSMNSETNAAPYTEKNDLIWSFVGENALNAAALEAFSTQGQKTAAEKLAMFIDNIGAARLYRLSD